MNELVHGWYRTVVIRPATPPWASKALKTFGVLVRELTRDQVHVRAATLAYWSLVAIVPALILAASLMKPMGVVGVDPLREMFYSALLAGSVKEVGATLDGWLSHVDLQKLGIVGFIGVAFTASRIYFSVEEAYNRLWNVRLKRSTALRLMIFYAMITLVPLLVTMGFQLTGRAGVSVNGIAHSLPVLVTAIVFVLGIRTIPATEVHWKPAIIGGLCSAVLFELAKVGFNTYTGTLGAANVAAKVYGSLWLFPIFLIWLYLLWLIVLFGVELAYVLQRHGDLLEAEDRLLAGDAHARRQPDALFAVQCLLVVVRNYARGLGPTAEPAVTHELHSEPQHVRNALETLEDAAVLAESPQGYLPAVPPDTLTIRDVIARYQHWTRPSVANGAIGEDLVRAVLTSESGELDRTLAELVRP